jgi:hypothetical protein
MPRVSVDGREQEAACGQIQDRVLDPVTQESAFRVFGKEVARALARRSIERGTKSFTTNCRISHIRYSPEKTTKIVRFVAVFCQCAESSPNDSESGLGANVD